MFDNGKGKGQDAEQVGRCISSQMGSRWYRSPEVILMQPTYNTQNDIWGVGCILAEMLLLLQRTITPVKEVTIKDQIMFPGNKCFPLTPQANQEYEQELEDKDQLLHILQVLGS